MKKIKHLGRLLLNNKRNIGILLYFTARLFFPQYINDNPQVMYIIDILFGTGLAHNFKNNINFKDKTK